MQTPFTNLATSLDGELFLDLTTRTVYATDASIYREVPAAVAYPKNTGDIIRLIHFAKENSLSLIPRTAGTSLAGQVVGPGIVVDVSRYMNRILEVNVAERYAWVEPGVILDELNAELRKSNLFFGPETSTANRCMIGGMLGNNACGLHSLVYGSTRDHTLAVKALLSDGSEAEFSALDQKGFREKCRGTGLESRIYREIDQIMSDPVNRKEIRDGYPDPEIPRRNTGYALDFLLDTDPFTKNGEPFNLCKLLGGSEGTLVFFTAIKLNLVDMPPANRALICAHFNSLVDTVNANLVVLKHSPTAVELMDHIVLECTKTNHTQQPNRFFLVGEPRAILIIEFAENSTDQLDAKIKETIADLVSRGLGYAYPVINGPDIKKVWDLRKAGLGSLANIPGDHKPVTVIEDCALPVARLTEYILEMEALFARNGMTCVYHAHIGTGELHLRPVLNLKDPAEVERFNLIAAETVVIVKKYRGSLSGEHGDGRLRAGMIPLILGEYNYQLINRVKTVFDPDDLFNPGKITHALPMDQFLRNEPGIPTPEIETYFDFADTMGVVRAAEKCNGSGDCRKSPQAGGGMCPSYQATRDEKHTTRARANILREFLIKPGAENPFDHPEIYEILDLCLSCKACKSECPSNVDMTRLKAEFLQHWYDEHVIGLRTRLIAYLPSLYRLAQPFALPVNLFMKNGPLSGLFKRTVGFHVKRSMPPVSVQSLSTWSERNLLKINTSQNHPKEYVYLFVDEFTNHQDAHIGIKAIRLLTALGYPVKIAPRTLSGRTFISKGLLKQAKRIARENVRQYSVLVSAVHPLIGIEPSAILGFRDEFPVLAGSDLKDRALELGKNALLIEEFLEREMRAGRISADQFTTENRTILLHGHCHQKALSSTAPAIYALSFPVNFSCTEIPSGCCGMAGAFGFEKEHFEVSMKVGELVLFPAVRKAGPDDVICASGTSCRHQILDGTGRLALHPVEVLFDALYISQENV
ncbi:MAG: FAD-linked oxidase C-terminal domain-containing protein [Bacteroidales bacterium]|jgi:FAD/FMN-containing dehydrogenase/Fe-S oxidoreductase